MRADEKLRILHTEASLGWGGQEIRILTEAAGMRSRGNSSAAVGHLKKRQSWALMSARSTPVRRLGFS